MHVRAHPLLLILLSLHSVLIWAGIWARGPSNVNHQQLDFHSAVHNLSGARCGYCLGLLPDGHVVGPVRI